MSAGPAAVGAYLFAFGAPRINQISHPQLLPHFFSLLVIWAVLHLLREHRGRAATWMLPLLLGSLVAQLYASFYLGWFLIFALGGLTALAMMVPTWRKALLAGIRHVRPLPMPLALSMGLVALLGILAAHYLRAAAIVGVRPFAEVSLMLPRWSSWLDLGPGSWLYASQMNLAPFKDLPMEWEHRLGVGLLTSVLALSGLWIHRHRPLARVLAVISLVFLAASLHGPGGFTLWHLVHEYVPGGAAIRAVSRMGVVALIPVSIGLALAMDHLRRRCAVVALVMAAVCLLEQGMATPSFSKLENRRHVQAVAEQISNTRPCDAFFYTRLGGERSHLEYQIDAMWAALATATPTINGYSGNLPPDWNLFAANLESDEDDQAMRTALSHWLSGHGIAADGICLLQAGRRGDDDAVFSQQDIPQRMALGMPSEVSLVVRNSGSSTWTRTNGYRLGSQAPQDNSLWGLGRVELPVDSVPPGESVIFRFAVTPSAQPDAGVPSSRRFRWRMVREGVHWFGTFSEPVPVALAPAGGP